MTEQQEKAKSYNERRSLDRTHMSISLTSKLAKWVQDSAADKGLTVSAYLEGVLRAERERTENPRHVAYAISTDPKTGQMIASPIRHA